MEAANREEVDKMVLTAPPPTLNLLTMMIQNCEYLFCMSILTSYGCEVLILFLPQSSASDKL